MADIEKVIKGLEHCSTTDGNCQWADHAECPYIENCKAEKYSDLDRDALELLKKQNEVIEELLKVGYPHNFQLEKPHIVNYMQSITKVVKKAVHFRNEECVKDAGHNRE